MVSTRRAQPGARRTISFDAQQALIDRAALLISGEYGALVTAFQGNEVVSVNTDTARFRSVSIDTTHPRSGIHTK